ASAGGGGALVGVDGGVEHRRGARKELRVLVQQQAVAPARTLQQGGVVLGFAAALLAPDQLGREGVVSRGSGASVAGGVVSRAPVPGLRSGWARAGSPTGRWRVAAGMPYRRPSIASPSEAPARRCGDCRSSRTSRSTCCATGAPLAMRTSCTSSG